MSKMYEVEQKFIVADLESLERRVAEKGLVIGPATKQIDRYFNHPQRDFAETDEAFRIRVDGDHNCITYKGPKIDSTTKTRREIELPIGAGSENEEKMAEVLIALGFREVAAVEKSRRCVELSHRGWSVELTLDDVVSVGTFAELELLSDVETLDEAKQVLHELSDEWGLGPVERRSYLGMLLATRGDGVAG
jgi:adenylate cyclase class 2